MKIVVAESSFLSLREYIFVIDRIRFKCFAEFTNRNTFLFFPSGLSNLISSDRLSIVFAVDILSLLDYFIFGCQVLLELLALLVQFRFFKGDVLVWSA